MIAHHLCPCCGYEYNNGFNGDYSICPICEWEDDPVQLNDRHYSGGANQLSLDEYQSLWKQNAASRSLHET